jgi:DNA-binding NarL/FixJ family response regulator
VPTTKEIAKNLDLAVTTTRNHLASIFKKLGLRNKGELACLMGGYQPMSGVKPESASPTIDKGLDAVKKETGQKTLSLTRTELKICRNLFKKLENFEQIFNEAVAQDLEISEGTVRNNLSSVYEKLGVKNRGELFRFMAEHKTLFGLDDQVGPTDSNTPEL